MPRQSLDFSVVLENNRHSRSRSASLDLGGSLHRYLERSASAWSEDTSTPIPMKRIKEKVVTRVEEGSDATPERDLDGVVKREDSESQPSGPPMDDFPDGGLEAWLVVCGTMCGTFATFGLVSAWGVFQAYYEETLLPNSTPSDIAWIGSLQFSLTFMPGLLTGRMFDIGYFKIPYLVSTIVLVVCTILVAECHTYWQFLLCQGFAVGLACGGIYGPTMGCLGHFFKRRRGLALGLAAVGSSVGGTIFPIAARQLIQSVGFKWTMRILGFIVLFMLIIGNITMKRRLPPKNVAGGLFNWASFKNPAFSVYCASSFFAFIGLFTLLTYLDISAVFVGISPDFSFYLLSITNASSAVGRLAAGRLTDKCGTLNIIIPFTLVAAVVTYAWPFVYTAGGLVGIGIVYGFMSGAYVSTFLGPVFELGATEDVGRRTGMTMTIGALGALAGPPISGAINNATGGYKAVGYYAGSVVVFSVVLMIVTRHLLIMRLWGKV